MPSKSTHSKSKSHKSKPAAKKAPAVKAKPKANHNEVHKASERHDHRPAGAHALGPADFVITRKWSGKTLESHVGAHVRVELPESTLRGMSWQLAKLPHGVELAGANVEHIDHPEGQNNQNRVFDFSLIEEGEYLLQFTLQRPFAQQGIADTFKVKLQAQAKN